MSEYKAAKKSMRREELKGLIAILTTLSKTASPYERNRSMPPHSRTTLTNAYRNGYNDALKDIEDVMQAYCDSTN